LRALVTFAVDPEFAAWRKFRKFEQTAIGDRAVYQTQIGRASVDVMVTGMGPENARRAAETAMSVPHTFCISSGFAGALRPAHKVGDILVAQAVWQIGKSKTIESAAGLVTRAHQDGAKCVDVFLTSERVVGTIKEKARLAPFGDAVDMESFAILSAARERNVPAVAIRVISDGFDQDMPVNFSTAIDQKGRVMTGAIVREIVRHPVVVPALIRLGRESRAAAESLANFLESYIEKASSSAHGWAPSEVLEVAAG
jgi:adenosylhomocysteine nucleosidase